jgi:hypothetical protein
MGRKRGGVPGLSFSWKRASGLSAAKSKLSRSLGVPLTKAGRQRKIGAATGCCVPIAFLALAFAGGVALFFSGASQAHGGGLDANGCHTNHATGEYHCHRGPNAGQTLSPGGTARKLMPSGSSRVYYRNCAEARAAGAAPVREGDPGYGRHLDRDGDGVGCE